MLKERDEKETEHKEPRKGAIALFLALTIVVLSVSFVGIMLLAERFLVGKV